MSSKPKTWLLIVVLTGCSYLGLGSALYLSARLSKGLIRNSSYYTLDDGTRVAAWHQLRPGEFRLDGYLYTYLLYPFLKGETAYWYIRSPEGSPYPEDTQF